MLSTVRKRGKLGIALTVAIGRTERHTDQAIPCLRTMSATVSHRYVIAWKLQRPMLRLSPLDLHCLQMRHSLLCGSFSCAALCNASAKLIHSHLWSSKKLRHTPLATCHCGETVGCRAQPWNTISLVADRFPGQCTHDSLLRSGLLLLCMWCSKQRSATLSSGHSDPNPLISGPHFRHRIRREKTSEAGQACWEVHNSCEQKVRTKLAGHGLASCDELGQRIV